MPIAILRRIYRQKTISITYVISLAYSLVLVSCRRGTEQPLIPQPELGRMFGQADAQIPKYGPRKAIAVADSLCKAKNYHTDQVNMLLYSHYSYYYQLLNIRDSALLFMDSAVNIADRHPMTDSIWLRYSYSQHFNKGSLLYNFGKVQPAIDEFFKAKDKIEKAGDECHANQIYHLIGLAMFRQERYAAARSYFLHTLHIFNKCNPPGQVYNYDHARQEMLNNIAQCDERLGRFDSARVYCEKDLAQIRHSEKIKAFDERTVNLCRGVVFGTIGTIMYKTGHADSAEVYFKKSLQFTNSPVGDIGDAQLTQVNLGDLYLSEKRYPDLKNILDSLNISLNNRYNEDARLGWKRLMYQYAAANHLLGQELDYYKSYISMRDSIADAKREQRETDLNEALNTRSQRLEISLLKKDNQLGKVYLWIVLSLSLLALIVIVLVLYNYRRSRRNVKVLTGLNNQINSQKTALEQANKDKDRILNVVAHDLRSPVGATAYLADSMLMADEVDSKSARSLGLIKQASQNALELINELLGLRADDAKVVKELTNLNQLIAGTVEMLRYRASEKQQQLVYYATEQELPVMAVPERLSRLISNLIINAIKFSHSEARIELTAVIVAGWVEFSVADQGIGIPENLQANIFDSFTSSRQQGTSGERSYGLGLSICKQITTEHGGYITFKSKPGEGTTFTVSLPLSNDV